MKLRNLLTLVKKDYLLSVKDWEMGFVVFGPVIAMLVIGYGVDLIKDRDQRPQVVITDYDQGHFTRFLENKQDIKLVAKVSDWREAEGQMEQTRAHAALKVPAGFTAKVKGGQQPSLSLILNIKSLSRSQDARKAIRKAVEGYAGIEHPAQYAIVFSKGTQLSIKGYLLQFGLVLQIIMVCIFFLPLSVGEEKEHGCLEALVLSPATMNEIIVAKVVYVTSVCFATGALMVAVYADGVTHIAFTLAYSFFGSLCFAAIGICLALWAKNRKHGNMLGSIALLVFLLPISFSDLFPGSSTLTEFMPSHWLFYGLNDLNSVNATLTQQLPNFGLLLGVGLVASIFSIYVLRRYDGSSE